MTLTNFYKTLFRSIREIYRKKSYCDVKLYARESEDSMALKPVYCHSLVLCSVAPAFKDLLSDSDLDKEDGEKCVYVPDLNHDVVQKFMDDVYFGLCSNEFLLDITYDLANVFGMLGEDSGDDGYEDPYEEDGQTVQTIILPGNDLDGTEGNVTVLSESTLPVMTFDNTQLKDLLVKGGQIVIQDGTLGQSLSFTTSTPALKRGIKRKSETSFGSYSLANKKINMAARVIQGPMRYNPRLTVNKASFSGMEMLKDGFTNQQGMFRAKTDSYFANSRIISDKDNTIMIGDSARQFRMKLPNSDFVALVAVGTRNGDNIVSTMACTGPSWSPENTFSNIIEMTKNICGTSFGAILRHPRCAEVNREKISRETIEKYKDEFKKLSEDERGAIGSENQKFLRDFDTEAAQMEFHHLPQKPSRMEFHLVDDMLREEIMDYAMISGDDADELVIQTFINFNYQKFTAMRLVTILCDTMSCFLGLGNTTSLTECQLLVDTFEMYATRTCQLLAVQELGVRNRDVCIDLIDVSSNSHLDTPKSKKRALRQSLSPGDGSAVRKKFPCTMEGCNRSFAKESQRNGHVTRVHTEPIDGKLCQPCGKILRGDRELKDHIYYHHSKKECKACNMTFPGAYLFYYHNSKVHFEVHNCDICGQEFKGREKLKVHKINKHLEDHQKPYVCSICGKGYAHKTKLESHQMNVHIRSRPYKCRLEGCDADFNELANRNAHEKNVHKFDYKRTMRELKDQQESGVTDDSQLQTDDSQEMTVE